MLFGNLIATARCVSQQNDEVPLKPATNVDFNGHLSDLPDRVLLPYVMQGSKYMVAAEVNGKQLLMRVDTGCRRCIIPVSYINEVGLQKPERKPDSHYKRTGAAIWKVRADLALGPIVRRDVPIDLFDGDLWPGTPVLGNNFFAGYRRFIRGSRAEIELICETRHAVSLDCSESFVDCSIPFRKDSQRGTPVVNATINGLSTELLFDTGANDALWLTRQHAEHLSIEIEGTPVAVGNSKIPCVRTNIPLLQLGGLVLTDVKTIICDRARATWATDIACFGTALLRGYDYLIDDPSGLIHIIQAGGAVA